MNDINKKWNLSLKRFKKERKKKRERETENN